MRYEEMEVKELLIFVNDRLEEMSLTKIGELLGVNESSIRKKLNKNGYKRVGKRFISENESGGQVVGHIVGQEPKQVKSTEETKEISTNSNSDIVVVQEGGNVGQFKDIEKLNTLTNNYDILIEMIEEYKKSHVVHMGGIVVQLPYEDSKDYKTSVRINKTVMEQFRAFCEEHKQFTQKELLSMALVEYMDRYK